MIHSPRFTRLRESRQLMREGRDWLQVTLGTALFVTLVLLMPWARALASLNWG